MRRTRRLGGSGHARGPWCLSPSSFGNDPATKRRRIAWRRSPSGSPRTIRWSIRRSWHRYACLADLLGNREGFDETGVVWSDQDRAFGVKVDAFASDEVGTNDQVVGADGVVDDADVLIKRLELLARLDVALPGVHVLWFDASFLEDVLAVEGGAWADVGWHGGEASIGACGLRDGVGHEQILVFSGVVWGLVQILEPLAPARLELKIPTC